MEMHLFFGWINFDIWLEERKQAGDDEIERLRIDNQKQLEYQYACIHPRTIQVLNTKMFCRRSRLSSENEHCQADARSCDRSYQEQTACHRKLHRHEYLVWHTECEANR